MFRFQDIYVWKMSLQQNKACHETLLLKNSKSVLHLSHSKKVLGLIHGWGSLVSGHSDFLQESKDVQVRLTCGSKLPISVNVSVSMSL